MKLDRRWLRLEDVAIVDPREWLMRTLPTLIREDNDTAAAVARLDLPPLTLQIEGEADSNVELRTTLAVEDGRWVLDGSAEGALVVTISTAAFSDWINWIANVQRLTLSGDMTYSGRSLWTLFAWELVLRSLVHGVPVHEPGSIGFRDLHGDPLDLHRTFTPDDAPDEVAHFLREAGYLHLRGWLDPADMAIIAADMDRAVTHYSRGDGRSWWATLESGDEVCVRMLQFAQFSERTVEILNSETWNQLREVLAADEQLVARTGTSVIEGLFKPIGVAEGISDVPWHRDCAFGGHPYQCGGLTIGISVTEGTAESGLLRVVAGSHRAATLDDPAWRGNDLPVIPLPTATGDLTVHIACTVHEALPPTVRPRKVMYTGFGLPDAHDARKAGALPVRDVRNEAHLLTSQPKNHTRTSVSN